MTAPARRRLAKCDYWIERQYGGRRIYWCWLIAVGAMGQSVTYRTLIGKRFVSANEHITELLQQESFMERKLAAQRDDIERLANRVLTAEARVTELETALRQILTFVAMAAEAGGHELVVPMDESEALARIGGIVRAVLSAREEAQ